MKISSSYVHHVGCTINELRRENVSGETVWILFSVDIAFNKIYKEVKNLYKEETWMYIEHFVKALFLNLIGVIIVFLSLI